MAQPDPRFLAVGHLNKPHGTKGEIFVWPLTDHPEGVFVPGVVVYLGTGETGEPDPDLPPLRIAAVRPFRRGFLTSFGGVEDRAQAEALVGHYAMLAREDLAAREEGEVFYHELLGMEVCLVDGTVVGHIHEVYELRPADLLEVHGPAGEVMIPFLERLVVKLDVEGRRLTVDPPEGLLDL
ncbi:MAG: ribosome maturation factor RimM [Gemmatimonadota bacterium]